MKILGTCINIAIFLILFALLSILIILNLVVKSLECIIHSLTSCGYMNCHISVLNKLQYILETLKEFSNKILTSSRLWYF